MDSTLTIGLSLIFSIVLFGPFLNKTIEGNLEAFLFIMGVISATLSRAWSSEVVREGLIAPRDAPCSHYGATSSGSLSWHCDSRSYLQCNIGNHCRTSFGGIHHRVTAAPPRRGQFDHHYLLCHRLRRGADAFRRTALHHRGVKAERGALPRYVLLFIPNSAVQMSEGRTWSSEDTQPYSFKVFFRS